MVLQLNNYILQPYEKHFLDKVIDLFMRHP